MSWAAVVLAGAVLAQVQPTLPEGLGNAPLPTQANGAAPAAGTQVGPYGNQSLPSLGPLPAAQENAPWKASPPAAPTAQNVQQSAVQAPATGGTPAGTSPNTPTTGSNLMDRLLFNQDIVDGRTPSPKATTPAPAPAAQTTQQATLPAAPPSNYTNRPMNPLANQPTAAQLAAVKHLAPEQMLKQAMSLPPSSVVAGRSVTLLDVLGQVTDRSKRVQIVHAYWELTRRMGDYRFCWEEARQIESIGLGRIDANLLSSAQQAADRELTAAELALIQSQYRLAEAAGLDSSSQLPLPADPPHISTYTTHFERIFADRSPAGQTRLIHRTMPLQYRLIDVRTEAVHAAQDALKEVVRSYAAGQVDAADVLATLHDVTLQRRAWIAAVAQYNFSIADYALTIAGPETTGRDLVSILIKLSKTEPRPAENKQTTAAPASPTLAPRTTSAISRLPAAPAEMTAKSGVPTLAPPQEKAASRDLSQGVPPVPIDTVPRPALSASPTLADAPAEAKADVKVDADVKPALAEAPLAEQPTKATPTLAEPSPTEADEKAAAEPTLAQPAKLPEKPAETQVAAGDASTKSDVQDAASVAAEPAKADTPENAVAAQTEEPTPSAPATGDMAVQTQPMVAVEEPKPAPKSHTVNRQFTPSVAGQAASPQAELVGVSAGVQAKRLTALLHGDINTICPDAKPVDLEACLDGVEGEQRRSVIKAYWEASLRVAECQVYRTQVAFLAELGKAVALGNTGTAEAMARLKTAQLDAKAQLLEAEKRLLDARYELTKRSGRSLDGPWLAPTTLPHAGDYRLHLDSMPQQMVESWTLKELAAVIPALNASLKARAVAVTKADSIRQEAVNAYATQRIPFNRVLSVVDQQADECLGFLNVLATYNQSIADYVTVVVPKTLPEEQLVATLVVRRK